MQVVEVSYFEVTEVTARLLLLHPT